MKRSLPLFQRTLSHFLQPAILFDLHQQKSADALLYPTYDCRVQEAPHSSLRDA